MPHSFYWCCKIGASQDDDCFLLKVIVTTNQKNAF